MRSYLDHASTSPVRPQAIGAMMSYLSGPVGDPGRIHSEGMTARAALEDARDRVADLVGARSREIVFTSGATEAITAACFGASTKTAERRHVVLSRVEHSAVREASERCWVPGVETAYVGVSDTGVIDAAELIAAIRPDTALVHIQWVNHEVGSVQPVARVVEHCRESGVLVHVDAAQAVGRLAVDFKSLGADLMSVSGHKFGGPPGTGALVVRRGLRLPPLILGGDQERARRAGMENVASLVGLGAAATVTAESWRSEAEISIRLRDRIRDWAAAADGIVAYGREPDLSPHIVCLGIEDMEPQPVLLGLDQRGVAVHSGSSCSSEALEPSPVLEAMGVDAQRSLRISLGWTSTDDDVDRLLDGLEAVLSELHALRSSMTSESS